MWIGLATQSLKDFGDKVARDSNVTKNQEQIAWYITEEAIRKAKQESNVELTRRGTERVAGFTGQRDYRKDF